MGEVDRGQRSAFRWLDNHGIANGESRRDLVSDEAEGEVEGGDGQEWPDRKAPDEATRASEPLLGVQGRPLASPPLRLFGSPAKYVHSPRRFGASIADRLAGLRDDQLSELVALVIESRGDARKSFRSLPG